MKTNEQLQRDVADALKWEPILDGMKINVTANNGVVTLSGYVDSYPKKLAAERFAKLVFGVRGVVEEIQVTLDAKRRRSDADIATASINALKWCDNVPDDRIQVSVEHGWVKLEGEVDWAYQRDIAAKQIEHITGVIGVSNLLRVKTRPEPKDVRNKIKEAFERSAIVDSSHIGIDVNGHIVTLKGPVRSWVEREDAEHAAATAPGVTRVVNNLEVVLDEEIF